MNEKMYWVCADVAVLASQLAVVPRLDSPAELQQRIRGLFEEMGRRAREVGITPEDVSDATYALAALIDELVLRTQGPGRQYWMTNPLQLIYFGENTAGEGFFTKIQQLQTQPARSHVLEIYFHCLALGFQGQYAVRGGEGIGAMIDHLGAILSRQLPSSETASPHGEPKETVRGMIQRDTPAMLIGLSLVAMAIVAFIGLKIVLASRADDAAKLMNTIVDIHTSPAAGQKR